MLGCCVLGAQEGVSLTRLYGFLEDLGAWRRISRAKRAAALLIDGVFVAALVWVYYHPTVALTKAQGDWLWLNGKYIGLVAVILMGILIANIIVMSARFLIDGHKRHRREN
jgi:hypothetical protein